MTKRRFLAPLFLACALLAGCIGTELPEPSTAPPRPNVVYILADDLGYGDIGAYGQKITRTPVLDRLAREGLTFTRHYAGSTVCAPSRASLMTGRHTGNVSIRGNYSLGGFRDDEERGQLALQPSETTIAEVLSSAGYRTAIVGKWGLGGPHSPGEPHKRGFDYAYGYLDQKQAHNHYPTHLWENGVRVPLANPFFIPHAKMAGTSQRAEHYRRYMGPDYAPDFLTDAAIRWIEEQGRDRPFFLYLAYTQPHAALQVPDAEIADYADLPDTPYEHGAYTPHPRPRAARAAMISRMDRDIGRVLRALEQAGFADDTLVVFSSDNGPGREGGADLDFFAASGGLRGEKRDLYEGGIRVPMIARWPGRIAAGTSSAHISAFWDVLPTLAELAGAPTPPDIDGLSFAATLRGRDQERHDHLYWEFAHERKGAQAVMMGDWKLIRHRPRPAGAKTGTVELFDLAADPDETTNLAREYPDVVARGIAIMERRSDPLVDRFRLGPLR